RLPPPDADGDAERATEPAARVGAGAPEAPGSAILQTVAPFRTEGEPGRRPPFEPPAEAPHDAELLLRRVGRETKRRTQQRVRRERPATAQRLDLVSGAVEGAPASQAVVQHHRGCEAVGKRAREGRAGAEFV